MKVVVLNDDGTYYGTDAVAIHYDGWKTEYFILNQDGDFERIFEYTQNKKQIEKRVFVFDADLEENFPHYVEDGSYEGYPTFIKNKNLLEKIRKGEKEIIDWVGMTFYNCSYFDVDNEKIVDDAHGCKVLNNFAGGFHDAVIINYNYDDKKNCLYIDLDGVWGLEKLTLIFEDVLKYHIEDDYEYNYFSIANLFYEDEEVCFVNDECNTKNDICEEWTFVYAKRLKFEFIFEKPKN